jgi:tripartite-type tricarboxylate transporter receptor subunit TctC
VINRRKMNLALASAGAWLAAGSAGAQSAPFPAMPVKIIVPFGAGGAADMLARLLVDKLADDLGQPVLVENRSGAGGVIGAQIAARSRPDGYTVLQISTTHSILPSLGKKLPYDLDRDFVPVFGVSGVPQVIAVRGASPIRSIADLAAAAKAARGGFAFSSGGTGSLSHLTAVRLAQELKIQAVHVPYRGNNESIQAVIGGHVQFTVANVPDVLELVKAGSLRLLAITSEQRQPYLPEVPSMAEQGFDVVTASWNCYVVPAETPAAVVDRLYQAFARIAGDPAVQSRLAKLGVTIKASNGAETRRFVRAEVARWRRVVETGDIRLEN